MHIINNKQKKTTMNKEKMIVVRTCKEQGTKEEVSFEYAVEKLSGYWTDVENLLMEDNELFTPYATYQLKK